MDELIEVITETRGYLARADANFDWSSWRDQEAALAEIDGVLTRLRGGHVPANLEILFLPTGPIQEVSLSSGWGDAFLELADRYDDCVARVLNKKRLGRAET